MTALNHRCVVATLRGLGLVGLAVLVTAFECGNTSQCGPYTGWSTTGVSASIQYPQVCPVPIPTRTAADIKFFSGSITVTTAQALEGSPVVINFTNQNGTNVNVPAGIAITSLVRTGLAVPSGNYTAGSLGPRPGGASPDDQSLQWDKSTASVPVVSGGSATGAAKLPYSYATVAAVSGPGSGLINTPYTYTASIKSGKSPYRYDWYIDGIKKPGTLSSYVYSGLQGTHSIRVDVWDAENDKGSATTTVVLNLTGGGGSNPPPPCDPGGGGGNPMPLRAAPRDDASGDGGGGAMPGVTQVAPRPMNQLPLPPC